MQRAKPEGVTRLGLFGSEDTAQAVCLRAPGAGMTGDLDQHIGLWDVNGVVTYLGQEHGVYLHHSIVITIMHAITCLLGADQVVIDSAGSQHRQSAATNHCLHRLQCAQGLLQTCDDNVPHC